MCVSVFGLYLSLGAQMQLKLNKVQTCLGLSPERWGTNLSRPICITIMKNPHSIELILREERTTQP